MTHAELLTECLKALNNAYIRPCERRLGIAWMATNKTQLARLLARTEALIVQRRNDPNSLENWATTQQFERAYHATTSDAVNEPSRFAGRHGNPTSTTR